MGKVKLFHIVNVSAKNSIYCDTYDACMYIFNAKDKIYRKTHKIISAEEYQKIINKKPVL